MTFDFAFDRLLGHEGRYVNNPRDPGGETNWGISKRSYPHVDIKNLTRDGAKSIYLRDFWNHIHADTLYDGVVFQLFDFAVNSGIQRAIRTLQKTVRTLDDGKWGPASHAAAFMMSESDQIMRLLGLRLKFMVSLDNWKDASRGWANRIADNLLYGAEDS